MKLLLSLSIFAVLCLMQQPAAGQDYVSTSTNRPNLTSTPYLLTGMSLFETDTSLWQIWTGTAWAQANSIVPPRPFYVFASTNRPTLSSHPLLRSGDKLFETDTGVFRIWSGSAWILLTYTASGEGAGVSSIAGTTNQISASAKTGAVTLSFPAGGVTLPGTTSGTFSGNLTGNASGSAGTVASISGRPSTELSDSSGLVRGAAGLTTNNKVVEVSTVDGSVQEISNQTANTVYSGPATGGAAAPTFRTAVAADVPAVVRTRSFGASFDGGGEALTAGLTRCATVKFACTISGTWTIGVDTGTASIDVWRVATGTARPTVANTILSGGYLSISSGTEVDSADLSKYTGTAVAYNDKICINLQAVASATLVEFVQECQQ